MSELRQRVAHLAHTNPELRKHLVPMLRQAGEASILEMVANSFEVALKHIWNQLGSSFARLETTGTPKITSALGPTLKSYLEGTLKDNQDGDTNKVELVFEASDFASGSLTVKLAGSEILKAPVPMKLATSQVWEKNKKKLTKAVETAVKKSK